MSIRLEIDQKSLEAVKKQIVTKALRAATNAVHTTTRQLEADFEGLTRGAVPGKAWAGWKSKVFPRLGVPARNPVGTVFPNGKPGSRTYGMMEYWTQPGVNRAKGGYWLAIPTKAAGATSRNRHLTPGEWERRTGIRLQFVYMRSKKFAYLVADGAEAKNKSGALRQFSQRRQSQGREKVVAVPIFILIPQQQHANKVSLDGPIRKAQANLISTYKRYLALED